MEMKFVNRITCCNNKVVIKVACLNALTDLFQRLCLMRQQTEVTSMKFVGTRPSWYCSWFKDLA